MTEIVAKDKIQRRDSRPISDHSRFDNSYRLAGTYRFGEYAPTMAIDVIPDDNHGIRMSHSVKSYTMKKPLLQNINLKEDTFLVPYSSILPRNYEKYITTPNIGDDVDSAKVGTTVIGFSKYIYTFFDDFYTYVDSLLSVDPDDPDYNPELALQETIKYLVALDVMLSSGSMLSALGTPLSSRTSLVDTFIDDIFGKFSTLGSTGFTLRVKIQDQYFEIGRNAVNLGDSSISVREFWNRIHDTFDWSVVSFTDSGSVLSTVITDFQNGAINYFVVPDDAAPTDLGKFYAYQISCAHFFSNDKVDYIYSASLWRENLRSLLRTFMLTYTSNYSQHVDRVFTWNGVSYYYDECAAYQFIDVMNSLHQQTTYYAAALNYALEYLIYIFGYRRSLRFVDYFTGSRTRPLAPGDTTVNVSNGAVDIVESIQKKWYVRLWSQISRVGHKLSEQMKGLFPDVEPSVDWHDPIWLHGATPGSIFAEDIENTSDNQFDPDTPIAVTSTLKGGSRGDFINLNVNDRYGIVISISYFDISRFYYKGIDRSFFHVDRYDRFNPFLQFMGDQKVYLKELNADSSFSNIFGYQGRYMEEKQRSDRAFGGFINNALPGMVFLADEGRDMYNIETQSPAYVRSYQCELDKFFISLSGWSLGTYYHFIMVTDNEIDSNRPMAYNPQIQ